MKVLIVYFSVICLASAQTKSPQSAKEAGVVSVTDFDSIQDAVAFAQTVNGKVVFPCGTFPFSREITISKRVTIEGGGDGDSGRAGKPCTVLQKTANVIGIHITSNANYTSLKDFMLTSVDPSGTADGIVIGDADETNGAGQVSIREVSVYGQGGNGINIRNGNSGVLDHVTASFNKMNGILISSQNRTAGNTNAWTIYSPSTGKNGMDGIRLEAAAANTVLGMDTEGNGRYGIYANSPYNYIQGYSEANVSNNVFTGGSCYDCFTIVRDVQNTTHQGSLYSWMYNMAGAGTTPYLDPKTGRMGARGGFSEPLVSVPYGPTVMIDSSKANNFQINVTNRDDFTISNPLNPGIAQRITITILNSSGGSVGNIKWGPQYRMSPWISPANGYSRSIDFEYDPAANIWLEIFRSSGDVGAASLTLQAPVVRTGLTSSGSVVVFKYPDITSETVWNISCHSFTTKTGSGGTVQLVLHPRSGAGSVSAAMPPLDLTNSSSTQLVSDFEIVPPNSQNRYVSLEWKVNAAAGGAFSIECTSDRVR